MKQLTMGDILNYVAKLKQDGMSLSAIQKLPIYLGADDELNGIHTGWFCDLIDDSENSTDFREMISEDYGNIKLAKNAKAILIS